MEYFIQALIIAVIGVVLGSVVKRSHKELALLLSVACCVLIGIFALHLFDPIISFFSRLRVMAGLEQETMAPVLKAVGIGLLTQITSRICADAGESAVASLVELCGSILALYVALPLLEAVLKMVEGMSGG